MSYSVKAIRDKFRKQGVFHTEQALIDILKPYIPNGVKQVYDPTCGVGNLLAIFGDDVEKFGQEIEQGQIDIANENLVNFTGVCGDTLKDQAFAGKEFDCIIANYPFSVKWEPDPNDARFSCLPAMPPKSRADFAFVAHILSMLSKDGTAIVINHPGILYRSGAEQKIRQWLVEKNLIDEIVALPSKMFVDTTISTALIVFKKNKASTAIKFTDTANNVSMDVDPDEIRQNDFTLSVNTYIRIDKPVEYIDPIQLQKDARAAMLQAIERDINMDKWVCDIEGFNHTEFLDEIDELIKQKRNS